MGIFILIVFGCFLLRAVYALAEIRQWEEEAKMGQTERQIRYYKKKLKHSGVLEGEAFESYNQMTETQQLKWLQEQATIHQIDSQPEQWGSTAQTPVDEWHQHQVVHQMNTGIEFGGFDPSNDMNPGMTWGGGAGGFDGFGF